MKHHYRYFDELVVVGVPAELLLLELHDLREKRAELLRRDALRANQLHTHDAMSDKARRRAREPATFL